MSDKTDTKVDDELVELIESVLKTSEGEALFSYLVNLGRGLAKLEVQE